MGEQSNEIVYELVKKVNVPEAEGIVIHCTNLRSAEILQDLEQELNKPVISAIEATVWYLLRIIGIEDKISDFGKLMQI